MTPVYYVLEVDLSYKIQFTLAMIIICGILYPLLTYIVKYCRAISKPVMFPYKHVVITGCGTGLGRSLVQEVYMKGAYITMIGRDKEKLLKVA